VGEQREVFALDEGTGRRREDAAIVVALAPDPNPELADKRAALWPYIHRVETLAQRWRWDGRPILLTPTDDDKSRSEAASASSAATPPVDDLIQGFPFKGLTTANVDEVLERFDGALFASRESDDHIVASAAASFVGPRGTLSSESLEVHRQRTGGGTGALYYRFSVRAYSRYEGVLAFGRSVDARVPEKLADPMTKVPEKWRRFVRRCGFGGEVPPPSVRFTIPLTSTLGEDDLSPGVLVVLDDGAYDDHVAGLAEMVEADISRVNLPDLSGRQVAELGPDPIIGLAEEELTLEDIAQRRLTGPLGYTFDTNTDAPLFTSASYVWRPPLLDGRQFDFSNYFFKLRFRRFIDPDGHQNSAAASRLVSAWTEGVWVRILAPSDRASVREGDKLYSVRISELVFARKAHELRRASGEAVELLPTTTKESSRVRFTYYALLTKLVPDAIGRTGQDAFLAFAPLSRLGEPTLAAPVDAATRIRLVEVMHYDSYKPEQESLESIFDALIPREEPAPPTPENMQDVVEPGTPKAMITRVSPPIAAV
jgi:hypothetical protein